MTLRMQYSRQCIGLRNCFPLMEVRYKFKLLRHHSKSKTTRQKLYTVIETKEIKWRKETKKSQLGIGPCMSKYKEYMEGPRLGI